MQQSVQQSGTGRWTARRLIRIVAGLAALALVAASCGDDGDEGAAPSGSAGVGTATTLPPQSGGTLTFAAYSNIPGLDPMVALGSGTSGGIQMATVYGTLARYDL